MGLGEVDDMKKEMKRKAIIISVVGVLFIALLAGLLFYMQTTLSLRNQRESFHDKLEQVDEIIANAEDSEKETTESFDVIQQSKAESGAFMFRNGVFDGYSKANLQECASLLDTENVYVLDKDGKILGASESTGADFTRVRFNQLRDVFGKEKVSVPFEVETERGRYRYYGAKIDGDAMLVMEKGTEELDGLLESTSTWEAMLKPVTVGLDGFTFAVSDKDYTFLYYPNEDLVGMDALTSGIAVENLADEEYSWITVAGEKLYCEVSHVDDAYVIAAVPEDEILSSRNITVSIILFTFIAVIVLVITYAFFIMFQEKKSERKKISENLYCNMGVGRKIGTISVVGLICILLVSFYMQTLFSLSQQSISNSQKLTDIERQINSFEDERKSVTDQYNERYLNKAQIAAYILTKDPELATRENLAELSDILDVRYVSVFDRKGGQKVTNSPYTEFAISDDPETQSYEFRKLLLGMEYFIQDAQVNEITGVYEQYIGVTLRDKEGNADGFVQICVEPSLLENVLEHMQLPAVLQSIRAGNGGIVFAIDSEKGKFVYYPVEKMMGRSAASYGISEEQQMDGYTGYLTIGSTKYYASSLEIGDNYIYIAAPSDVVTGNRLSLTVTSGIAGFLALLILFVLLTFSRRGEEYEEQLADDISQEKEDKEKRRVTSAASRWQNSVVNWAEKSPEQQLFVVFKFFLGLLALAICIAVLFRDRFFDSQSIFTFVMSGEWAHGMNIFAFTCTLLIVCVGSVITMVAQKILSMLARTFGAKGETICRLLHNFVKYVSVLAILFYCLSLFGIDTKTLLASAGILTLIIGLGAQTLVSDILAGLFIIFEGEFQVGDIVTIGDWRGTVVEIGIRTTKILDGSGNIKIISNSDVTGVINMTREYSYSWVDVGIEYGESLERVESVLADEFPNIREHIPGILDGPFYKGVVSLGDNSVNIRVMVLCAEADRVQMERDLNREMKIIFDKHNINIPFPQIVINQPAVYQEATALDRAKSEQFNREQREASGSYIEEEDEEEN
ncbi:MAG TPA: mechanosensitive ion channel [Candidatus Avanaerovorax faecigallinarum]|nr:mechanosensitive ion channel [Candidatus Avanaerovorax faecigallinarum]